MVQEQYKEVERAIINRGKYQLRALSYSGKSPHMVTAINGGGFSCDASCPNWKSISFCSHTVAVAEVNGKLIQFVDFLRKKAKVPSVTKLVTCHMPRGRGRKGGTTTTRRKSQAPTTRVSMTVGAVGGQDAGGGISVAVGDVGNQMISPESIGSQVNTAAVAPSMPGCSPFSSIPTMQPPYYPGSYYSTYSPFGPYPYPANTFFPGSPGTFSQQSSSNPYQLSFIKGNISTCIACHNKYPKSPQPPNDLCIKHQEWRQFTPQGATTPQS